MDHVAIMNKSWKLIPKILDGRKKIESRWSVHKCSPWGRVNVGDKIYFKNSGESVFATATVDKVKSFSDLNYQKVSEIIHKYGGDGGISVSNVENSINWAREKRYCTLIYLNDPKEIKPFGVDKTGFGSGCAWIIVENIESIKKR